MSDVATHSSKPSSHANGEVPRGTLSERREARRLRREERRALRRESRMSAAELFPRQHPYVTAGLLVAGGALLGALVSRAVMPLPAPGGHLLRRLARQFAL